MRRRYGNENLPRLWCDPVILLAYLHVIRHDAGQAAAYGLNLVADGKDHAIASVYLADRPSVSEAIRRAIQKAVDLRPAGTEKVVVHSREAMFRYWRRNHYRLTQGIVTVPVDLRWLPPDKKNTHAFWLAEDAVRRGTTIEEIL